MDYYVGQILLLPYTFAPKGTMRCQGQLLPVVQYQTLYSLIGTKFGGDGISNFGLPNLMGAEPVPGLEYCIVLEGVYPQRP